MEDSLVALCDAKLVGRASSLITPQFSLCLLISVVLPRSSLIVFKYCEHFTFGKSYFTGVCGLRL